jgi:hypothetical protein
MFAVRFGLANRGILDCTDDDRRGGQMRQDASG